MSGKGLRVLVFTGEGKGKTTAAVGCLVRAAGHGLRCCMVQFIKAAESGEMAPLERLGVTVMRFGLGFLPRHGGGGDVEPHRRSAQEGLEQARAALGHGHYDVVVLDEICLAVASGLIQEQAVLEAIETAGEGCAVVLTGRGATAGLIARADTVTRMTCVKHGLDGGIAAQKGVEL